jgi:hypothetical protein
MGPDAATSGYSRREARSHAFFWMNHTTVMPLANGRMRTSGGGPLSAIHSVGSVGPRLPDAGRGASRERCGVPVSGAAVISPRPVGAKHSLRRWRDARDGPANASPLPPRPTSGGLLKVPWALLLLDHAPTAEPAPADPLTGAGNRGVGCRRRRQPRPPRGGPLTATPAVVPRSPSRLGRAGGLPGTRLRVPRRG